MNIARYSKSIANAAVGLLAWGKVVVASAPHPVTANEWLALGAVAVSTLLVFTVRNDAASTPSTPPFET